MGSGSSVVKTSSAENGDHSIESEFLHILEDVELKYYSAAETKTSEVRPTDHAKDRKISLKENHHISKNLQWSFYHVSLEEGKLMVKVKETDQVLTIVDLSEDEVYISAIGSIPKNGFKEIVIVGTTIIHIKVTEESLAQHWLKVLRREAIKSLSTKNSNSNENVTLNQIFDQFHDLYEDDDEDSQHAVLLSPRNDEIHEKISMVAPPLNIVILVVGTRGDVQPFGFLGMELQKHGHRVRLATHAEYRDMVIEKGGLEFYPLGGDPRKLSEYMVKTGGRLIPNLLSKEERMELPEKMKMLHDICYSTFPACTDIDPTDPDKKPFHADAIISNPVSYGHIHVAEAISVPLHIMFPQPWSPTKCFPHPLSNLKLNSKWSTKNYMSYKMVDEFMWIGLGSMINRFRKKILHIPAIHAWEKGDSILNDHKVPISHMWSPSFVPKCIDWPSYVDVVGEFRSMDHKFSNAYVPDQKLLDFLAAGDKPIFIGFGSMVIDDPSKLVNLIKEAAAKVNCRVLLQSGWTKYADDYEMISEQVMVIGAMPHDWLLYQVCGVVHHGGAGTTSAGLRAGNPTFICPFFGDQHFWAEMVSRSGCGPKGCPVGRLTTDKMVEAFELFRKEETIKLAQELGDKMMTENGVAAGVHSFHHNLPLSDMLCEISIFDKLSSRLAKVYCVNCGLKMCEEVDRVIHRQSSGRGTHVRMPFRSMKWGMGAPSDILDSITKVNSDEKEKVIEETIGATKHLIARPVKGGRILVEEIKHKGRSEMTEIESVSSKSTRRFSYLMHSKKSKPKSETDTTEIREDEIAVDIDTLTENEIPLESAYVKTLKFLRLWESIDTDGSRNVDEKELSKFLTDKAEAKEWLSLMDSNNHVTLSFTEMAWIIVSVMKKAEI